MGGGEGSGNRCAGSSDKNENHARVRSWKNASLRLTTDDDHDDDDENNEIAKKKKFFWHINNYMDHPVSNDMVFVISIIFRVSFPHVSHFLST